MFEDVLAMERPLFRRVASTQYEVINSKETFYYSVSLLAGKAIACECPSWKFKHGCHHAQIAEEAEVQAQELLPIPEVEEEVFYF